MMNATRPHHRARLAVRGVCVATIAGLTLATVPSVATASPTTMQAPLLAQAVVGLAQGATGADVVALQKSLIAAGVTVPGGADGVFGPATKSALTAYQSRSGIATTGTVDNATATSLGLIGAAPAAAATGGLSVGAKGDAVKALQTALMASGVFVPGGADGVFGPATKTAVSNFQRWNGLPVTGQVDAATSSKLKLGSAPSTPAAPAGVSKPAATTTPVTTAFVGMKTGARGDNVKVLQRALIAAGISVRGGADGVFGPMTAAALTSYQQANGLTANGVVDAAVVAKLALVVGAPTPAPSPAPTPAPPVGASHVGLKVGSNGQLVKDLQRALMQSGLTLRGGADGVFGNMTKSTLMQFQKAQGRAQTGVVTAADASVLSLGTTAAPQGVSNQAGFAVYGERGARVTALQQSLIKAGVSFAGGADGVFGAATAGAILAFQRREGLPATGKIDQATATRLGTAAAPAPAPPSTAGISIDVFPVQGKCWFGDTWQAPRGGGRLHEGVDVIAARGKLLYAVVSGTISKVYNDTPGALAGNGVRVAQDNGTYFTYLHMDTFGPGIVLGAKVVAGQVIGTVGSTGSSATPHLHFEVHPGGGAAVNPYPVIKPIDACNVTAPRA
ncbi:MAG TPA: peptidoglycan-binding protein [Ilumatobacteraceae bacterium]|nr:peptidoglycan-binding protein [Ilumatobacteraceae bacterium]